MSIDTPFLPLASLLVLEGTGVAIVDAITAAHHERLGGASRTFEPLIELELAVVRPRDASCWCCASRSSAAIPGQDYSRASLTRACSARSLRCTTIRNGPGGWRIWRLSAACRAAPSWPRFRKSSASRRPRICSHGGSRRGSAPCCEAKPSSPPHGVPGFQAPRRFRAPTRDSSAMRRKRRSQRPWKVVAEQAPSGPPLCAEPNSRGVDRRPLARRSRTQQDRNRSSAAWRRIGSKRARFSSLEPALPHSNVPTKPGEWMLGSSPQAASTIASPCAPAKSSRIGPRRNRRERSLSTSAT